MNRNKIKIICNPQANTLSYQFQNEQTMWVPVSQFSPLAERKYTATTIRKSSHEILTIIDSIYNPGNRGVDISIVSSDEDRAYLRKVISENFPRGNIDCGQQTVKAAVAGRTGIGKTTLIESLSQTQRVQYSVTVRTGYRHYKSGSNTMEWFEIDGIDLGMQNLKRAEQTVDELSKQGLTLFIYCLDSSRVESAEEAFIQHIHERHPNISLLGILTNAGSIDDPAAAEKAGKVLGIKVLPIMAKDKKVRSGVIKAFGHENVLRAIFGEV